ncbi:DUF4311 domain-containing protein [uncultured Traorella sp.]|uniref:DUF4311 domain-containing protein n=1 Tax=uncultured Traorella sp. TaxID=1929048 RepID=UPI0025D6B627|nr:DUF4311 domain-containing protein [uncultured Traorella sp.]
MIDLVFKSVIIGALAGAGAAGGAARMYHAPEVQGMGSFRTLGEMNACNGDPISHFSYGLGFIFSSAGDVVGMGALSSNVLHRIVPNWSAAFSVLGFKDGEAYKNPAKMTIMGAIVGAVVVTFLNTLASFVPTTMAQIASNVVSPAATLLLNPVLPVAFWLAALSAGKEHGTYATIFGIIAQFVMENAAPGCILGILIGQSVQDTGLKSKRSISMLLFVSAMFFIIAYFRGLLPF